MPLLSSLMHPSAWYWAAAAAPGLLLGLLLVAGGRALLRWHVAGLSVVGIIWGVFLAETAGDAGLSDPGPAGFIVEIAYIAAWFLLLYRVLQGPYRQSMPPAVQRSLGALWGLILAAGAGGAWWWFAGQADPLLSGLFSALALVAALMGVALVAQLSRDAPIESRRALRLMVAATGLATGAQALLAGSSLLASLAAPEVQVARAALTVVAVVLLAGAVRQQPQWSLAVFVSPQARTYLPRLAASAGFLLAVLAAVPVFRTLEPETAQA